MQPALSPCTLLINVITCSSLHYACHKTVQQDRLLTCMQNFLAGKLLCPWRLTCYMLPCSLGSMLQQVKHWVTERLQGGWSRLPTQDPYVPTALGDPLIPEGSSSSSPAQQSSGSQRTGEVCCASDRTRLLNT